MLSSDELQRLLREAQANPEAADRLVKFYRPVLRLIAEQLIGSGLRRREDASDIVQRTALEACQAFTQFKGQSEPELSAWLQQILRRNVSNLVRDNRAGKRDVRREQQLEAGNGSVSLAWLQPTAKSASPSLHVIRAEAALNLALALEKLPEHQGAAVRMRHLQGRGLDEIAAALDKSPAAVAGLLRRGLQSLRELMGGETRWI
jgi:RNA polymerase sigma-70 factor (ECF subfamily)